MFKTPMGLEDIKIKSVSRLGAKKDEVIRPVKVTLENFSMKKRILDMLTRNSVVMMTTRIFSLLLISQRNNKLKIRSYEMSLKREGTN